MQHDRDTSGVDSLLSQAKVIELMENSVGGRRGRGRGRGLNISAGRGRVDQNGVQFNFSGGRGRGTRAAPFAESDALVSNVNSYVLPHELVDFHAKQIENAGLPDANKHCPASVISKNDSEKKVQCPVLNNIICLKCQNICAPPFMSCSDGHLFCNDCIKGLEKCHVCEHKQITSRQLGLESIVMAMEWPCKFSEKGCRSVLKMDMMKEHTAKCTYKAYQKCIIDGCKEYVSSDKHALAKHMIDCHNCKILKIPLSCSSKRAVFKTCFKVNDYVKDKIDCKKICETVNVLETDDNFFFCKITETMNTLTFKCYTIGDSVESECGFYCSRGFKQNGNSFMHMICEPIISITEKSLGKRKMEEYEPVFSFDKKKIHILSKSTGKDSKNFVECTVKIGKLRNVS